MWVRCTICCLYLSLYRTASLDSSEKGHTQADPRDVLFLPVSASSVCTLNSCLSFCLCSWGLCLARGKLGSVLSLGSLGMGPGHLGKTHE